MNYQIYTLSNGVKVIHAPSPTSVAYCGFAMNAGTRDEPENQQGMAHFVEHLLFKGTRKRKAWHILNRMENVGGDLNAYTNKEETLVYCAFMKSHFARAVELLTDIVFHSTFPESEVKKEVEVIIDEIQSYRDSPAELIFDDFEELIYPNHPLGWNILGRADLLRGFTGANAAAWVNQFYRTSNLVFFVWASLDFKYVIRVLERALAEIPASSLGTYNRMVPEAYHPRQLTIEKGTHQAHVMLGGRGYDAFNEKRTVLYVLNNVLGGPGMNSRLNVALREKRGLVYNVESNVTSYTDTGTFSIYFGCDTEDVDDCLDLVYGELRNLRTKKMSDMQLHAVKKQLIGQMGVAADNFENMALEMGKCFLHYGKFDTGEVVNQRVEQLTAEELLSVANEIFDEKMLTCLRYV